MNDLLIFKFINKVFKGRDFDRNIFYIMSFLTIMASLDGLIIGPIFHNIYTTISTGIISIIYLAVIIVFYKSKNYSFGNSVIVAVTGFFLFPSIFFTTYGFNSAFPLYMLLIPAAYGVICKRKRSLIHAIVNLILYDYMLYYSYKITDKHAVRLVPFLIGFAVSYILILSITGYLSISTRRLNKKLLEASIIDELTHVYNRRFFDTTFASYDYRIAAIFDIDDFKKVNDVYGHQTGDVVLTEFAQILLENSSDEFKSFRWGGEEFVILSKLDLETSLKQIEKIMDTVREDLKDSGGNCVTVSCGTSETDKASLMESIDKNLYIAKTSGKNKLICNGKFRY